MCGIAGKMYFDSARRVDEELLSRMCAALAHHTQRRRDFPVSLLPLALASKLPHFSEDRTTA